MEEVLMKCGFDRLDITPILPVRLSGFGKVRWANEIHDPIMTRLFLFKGEEENLLIQLDLVAVDDLLYTMIEKKTGIKKDRIVLMATHTHSGPVGTLDTTKGALNGLDSIFGEVNTNYCECIADQVSDSVNHLRECLQPFTYRILKGKVEGLGTDRHDLSLPYDEDMLLIEFKLADGKRALLTRMSCHPTVMNQENCCVTADFPGAIEPLFPEYQQVAYVNGSCGNMSTRFTRKGNGFEEVERFGKLVAKQMKELLNKPIPFKEDFSLCIKRKEIELPPRKFDTIEEATRKLEETKAKYEEGKKMNLDEQALRVLKSVYEGAQNNMFAAMRASSLSKLMLSISWIKLPEINLITVPCELFSTLSDLIKEELNSEFIGYTNGYFLYLPDEESFRKQVYESFSSPFAAGSGELLMNEIKKWVKG